MPRSFFCCLLARQELTVKEPTRNLQQSSKVSSGCWSYVNVLGRRHIARWCEGRGTYVGQELGQQLLGQQRRTCRGIFLRQEEQRH